MMRITPVVKQLLILNIIFYIGSQFPTTHAYPLFSEFYLENPNFKIWQPLTSMFMHAPLPNFTHILFNMFALYSFGSALEHFWGGTKFLFFYISCGLGAIFLNEGIHYYQYHHALSLLQDVGLSQQDIMTFLTEGKYNSNILDTISLSNLEYMFQAYNSQTLGASGAIYGLLVAFAFIFPTAELGIMFIPIPIKAKYFVPGLLAVDLFLGFNGQSIFGAGSTGVAHFAHIGGALTGFIMMWFWKKNQFNNRRWN
jgi:membrane associated rhomboid family serine protease